MFRTKTASWRGFPAMPPSRCVCGSHKTLVRQPDLAGRPSRRCFSEARNRHYRRRPAGHGRASFEPDVATVKAGVHRAERSCVKATDIRQSARNLHLAMTLIFSELLRNPVFDSHLRYRKGIIKHENRELTSCSRKSAVCSATKCPSTSSYRPWMGNPVGFG